MDQHLITAGVAQLSDLVKEMAVAGVADKKGWQQWRRDRAKAVAERLDYRRQDGMPEAGTLISPFFHPDLPLIGFNYTHLAHNTLHLFGRDGWTAPIRLCRGIVFDRDGRLIALPFPKFFNYGEHPETRDLPDEPFEATVKHDGHLGIVFEYGGRWHLTTRGMFGYRTAQRGQAMLDESIDAVGWPGKLSADVNPLVEIIHPETKVFLHYRKARLILIGAFNRQTLADADFAAVREISRIMGLESTSRWTGKSIADLAVHMKDLSVRNREGFVVRFQGGLRVKFKFKSYVSLMIAAKLEPHYVMNRLINGTLEKLIGDLDFEVQEEARRLTSQLTAAAADDGCGDKSRRQRLYRLLPDPKSQYQRGICRDFIRFLDGKLPPASQPLNARTEPDTDEDGRYR